MSTAFRIGEGANQLLSWSAVVLIALFVGEAAWLRATLGHWPVVYRDQAEGAVATAFEASTSWLLVGLFFATPVWGVSLVAVAILMGRRTVLQRIVLFAGSAGLLMAAAILNPFGFPEWWAD